MFPKPRLQQMGLNVATHYLRLLSEISLFVWLTFCVASVNIHVTVTPFVMDIFSLWVNFSWTPWWFIIYLRTPFIFFISIFPCSFNTWCVWLSAIISNTFIWNFIITIFPKIFISFSRYPCRFYYMITFWVPGMKQQSSDGFQLNWAGQLFFPHFRDPAHSESWSQSPSHSWQRLSVQKSPLGSVSCFASCRQVFLFPSQRRADLQSAFWVQCPPSATENWKRVSWPSNVYLSVFYLVLHEFVEVKLRIINMCPWTIT